MKRIFPNLAAVFSLVCLSFPLNVNAQDAGNYLKRGNEWQAQGEQDKAIANYNQALVMDPTMAWAYVNRSNSWLNKGEYDKAIADCNQALAINPNLAMAYNNRGVAWNAKGDRDIAIIDYGQALRLDPNMALAYTNRGYAWRRKRQYDKALADFDRALTVNPNNARAYYNRGTSWYCKGAYDRARADFNQALAINPQFADAYNDLAAIQAVCPDAQYRDGPKAFKNASHAYLLSGGKSFIYTCTLAEAYAENGDFQKAREWMEKAIAMSAAAKYVSEEDKLEMRSALELFKQGKPYREELQKKE